MNINNNDVLSYQAYPLEWDTKYFEVKSGRVNINSDLSENQKKEIKDFCSAFEFCTIVNKNNNNKINHWLGIESKAFLSDVNIQFEKSNLKQSEELDSTIYLTNSLDYSEDIANIARNSFEFSRFFNDPNLQQQKSRNVYHQWVLSSFNQPHKYFIYQSTEDTITGFLLFSLDEGNKAVNIELIAVNKNTKGKGIGKKLISKLEMYSLKINYDKISVGTQIKNNNAINFYQSCGFKYISSNPIFHLWNI